MTQSYDSLPTKFDFTKYYLNQAAGGPAFPVFRARQRGGSFLTPLFKRFGIPAVRWLGKQAATLASGLGSSYLNKGKLTKDDVKGIVKKQGKEVAASVLDKIKQQIGSGSMTHRRDARLSSLIPVTTAHRDGALTNRHMIRGPTAEEQQSSSFIPLTTAPRRRRKTKRTPLGGASRKKRGKAARPHKSKSKKQKRGKTKRGHSKSLSSSSSI